MSTEQERADFESWYMRELEVYPRRNESGGFKSQYVNAMFKSWKAGRAALQSQKLKTNDAMLSAVIRMPFEMAMADPISRMQFYQRAQQALDELEALQSQDREDALTELLDSIDELLKTQEQNAWTSKHKYSLGERMNAGMRYQKARQAIDHARKEQQP